MTYITKEELEEPRTAKALKSWVDAKIEEIGNTAQGRTDARLRKGLLKDLFEEALPLGIFSDHYFKKSKCVVLKHVIGSQNYDVEIKDKRLKKSPLKYLEITQSHEGHDAHLRIKKLEEDGHVNVLGKVIKTGTERTGLKIKVENMAFEHSEIVSKELQRILDSANRKKEKKYPDNTALLIMCDDSIAFKKEEDLELLQAFMNSTVIPVLNNFIRVFIVGWSSKLFLEFD